MIRFIIVRIVGIIIVNVVADVIDAVAQIIRVVGVREKVSSLLAKWVCPPP